MLGQSFFIEDNILKGVKKEIVLKSDNIGQVILQNFSSKPDHVGQIDVDTGRQTTYREMKENSIRCALWLQKQNVGSGDVVVVCTHNQLDAYIPAIATFIAGAIYNPWYHEMGLKTAQHLMGLTRPKVIFCCESVVDLIREVAKQEKVEARIIVFGRYPATESLKDILSLQTIVEVKNFESGTIVKNDVAMILFSSGTTGLPKGVAHSYISLLKNLVGFTVVAPKETSRNLWYSSLYWISGTYCMLQALLTNATRILHANFDPDETCKVIEKFKVNWFFIAPSSVAHFCKSKVCSKYKLETLKTLITGGSKLSREITDELGKGLPHVAIVQAYGMTEVGGVATARSDKCKNAESVGFVVPNVEIKVIDVESDKILGPNQAGELCIKNPTSMVGYYKNPVATKAAIDEEGWMHTGDKGYYDENGEVVIIDRLKEIMKFRGHHISPFEIEDVLVGHPSVIEVAVVPVPHDLDLERPMAFVKRVPGSKVSEEELIKLSSTLGENKKLWGGVKFLDKIPYTASGKICRKELKEMAKMNGR